MPNDQPEYRDTFPNRLIWAMPPMPIAGVLAPWPGRKDALGVGFEKLLLRDDFFPDKPQIFVLIEEVGAA